MSNKLENNKYFFSGNFPVILQSFLNESFRNFRKLSGNIQDTSNLKILVIGNSISFMIFITFSGKSDNTIWYFWENTPGADSPKKWGKPILLNSFCNL